MKNDIGCGGPPRPGCCANTRYDPAASAIASAVKCGISFFITVSPRPRILSNVCVGDVTDSVRLDAEDGWLASRSSLRAQWSSFAAPLLQRIASARIQSGGWCGSGDL